MHGWIRQEKDRTLIWQERVLERDRERERGKGGPTVKQLELKEERQCGILLDGGFDLTKPRFSLKQLSRPYRPSGLREESSHWITSDQ